MAYTSFTNGQKHRRLWYTPLMFANLATRDSTVAAQFIFRYVFISIALWVPAVVRRTARNFPTAPFPVLASDLPTTDFYYVQKGLWYDKRRSYSPRH